MAKDFYVCPPEDNESEIDLLSLPFKSTYKILSWRGIANGGLLTPSFNAVDVQDRYLIIKSFTIVPYYNGEAVDLYVTDGVTTNAETIPTGVRINRIFDRFVGGTTIVLLLNGNPTSFFGVGDSFPIDLDLQSIYYKFPEKLQTITLAITSLICSNIQSNASQNPFVKVEMEVYLI